MKILLVDDSRAIAMVTTARLESFGHSVKHAMNGKLAIELFQSEYFDLVLMDIEMPEMNGFETTNRIRALEGREPWAWTPIIFVTATDTETNLVTAIEAGGDDFISKGVSESVLQAKMKAMARIAAMRQRLAQANSSLQDQANRDGLTGLFNRRAMDMRVDALWEDAVRFGKPFSLLMIDVDNFKKYNDHYGHPAGDECLRTVAACIEGVVKQVNADRAIPGVFAARYGGEEFAVIIPEATCGVHVALGLSVVEAVAGLAITHEKNADWGVVSVSVGAACIGPASGVVGGIFRLADELLYKAKNLGRNRIESN
jgi:diguanylate cyclase (GGDEF)-like protein